MQIIVFLDARFEKPSDMKQDMDRFEHYKNKYGHVSTWTFFGHSAEIGKTKVLEDHEGTNTSNEIEKTRNQSISKDIGNCGADFCLLFGQLFSSNKDDCFGCNYLQGVVDYKAYVQHRVGSCG